MTLFRIMRGTRWKRRGVWGGQGERGGEGWKRGGDIWRY